MGLQGKGAGQRRFLTCRRGRRESVILGTGPARRAWRWQARAAAGTLADRPPGGNPVHGLPEWEERAIVELFEEWGPVDLSHRKLAHRGSYIAKVWVSPSTVDRVLARHGLALKGGARAGRSQKKPWPEWTEWRPNQLWCWDASQFERGTPARYAYAIVDLVSRKCRPRGHRHPGQGPVPQGPDPEGLLDDAAELERVRVEYKSVRLHEAIGYVTPDDQHEGRGGAICKARSDGLERADAKGRLWHRRNRGKK